MTTYDVLRFLWVLDISFLVVIGVMAVACVVAYVLGWIHGWRNK